MEVVYSRPQAEHDPQSYYSAGGMYEVMEIPARADYIMEGSLAAGLTRRELDDRHDQGDGPITAVHSLHYVDFLRTAFRRWKQEKPNNGDEANANIFVRVPHGRGGIQGEMANHIADGSSPIRPGTFRGAYWSAQSVVNAADIIKDGSNAAFALCRPPGHHARTNSQLNYEELLAAGVAFDSSGHQTEPYTSSHPDMAGGFCFFNNAAIGAERLRQRYGRIAILDTDLHHGQGIEEHYYDREDTFYASIHADTENFYPVGTGLAEDRGRGRGLGHNLNLPMQRHATEEDFFKQLDTAKDAIDDYNPDALVLSLGFDIRRGDPQAELVDVGISREGLRRLGGEVARIAAGKPVLVVQEGGYDLDTLADSTERFFNGFQE